MSTNVENVEKERIEKVGAQLPPEQSNGKSTPDFGRTSAKYKPFPPVALPDRTWPDKHITHAPIWCSVDLRDGNQALATPMSVEEKLEMFDMLVRIGFKQIEVGFPSASQVEFDFCRRLIEENRVPEDVAIQVLVQAREELIRRSFEALKGAGRAIMHLYNSTNPAQRRIVFGMSKDEIKNIAVRGATLIRQLADENPETDWTMEYSPESFVLTELDFSLEVCQSVTDAWRADEQNPIILNLPTTVESSTPNVHADQIEWFCRHLKSRDAAIISLHTHNDRGTGVAATELALLAGAERVEGTLFGNGERTGNLDIVTSALNMTSQGVESNLDFSDLPKVREVYERCTRMEVPPRQPYAGDLVFTAFSGSHQDAINKGFAVQKEGAAWEVPYLPIDPKDIGRSYEAIIRLNTQSGKGGVAYILESRFGLNLPKEMRVEFGRVIQQLAESKGREIAGDEVYKAFVREYLKRGAPVELLAFRADHLKSTPENRRTLHRVECVAQLKIGGDERELHAAGNGPIDAFVAALQSAGYDLEISSYAEHSLSEGKQAKAVAYVQIASRGAKFFGAAIDTDVEMAAIKAVVSALNRSLISA